VRAAAAGEEKLQRKHEALSELLEEHVRLKQNLSTNAISESC
jgi:hypothetical protein